MSGQKIEHEITPEVIEQARSNPGGNVYKIAGQWGDDEHIPGSAIIGAWKVNSKGNIIGDFVPNPNFDTKWNEKKV